MRIRDWSSDVCSSDLTFYWALLAPAFFSGRIADVAMFGRLRVQFERGSAHNAAMQDLLREWGERNAGRALPIDSRLLVQDHLDWFHELNRALSGQHAHDAFAESLPEDRKSGRRGQSVSGS